MRETLEFQLARKRYKDELHALCVKFASDPVYVRRIFSPSKIVSTLWCWYYAVYFSFIGPRYPYKEEFDSKLSNL